MNSELTAYITLICTSGVLNLYLCFYVFVKRHHYTNIANLFMLYTLSLAIYCLAAAFGLMSTTLQGIKLWTIIQYVGMPISVPLGLLFVMQYLGIRISRKRYMALLIIPLISFVMVATNSLHHLHYRVYEIDPVLGAPYVYQEIGIWYMIHGIFTFACMVTAFLLALSRWRETAKIYRPQLLSLTLGQFIPMFTAFLYLIGVTPLGIDPVPMILWLSSLLYLWSISSSRLFAVMPIAKDAIFNSINDGVIVLDESYRLIEFNEASKLMFPELNKSMLGMTFDEAWAGMSGASFPIKLENETYSEELHHAERIYHVRISLLQQENARKGLLVIFTDITELKRLQIKLEQQAYYDELTQIYNRRAFFQHCKHGFAEAKETGAAFTVVLVDIDYFKKVNDTYGHAIGDQLLVHVAQTCQAQLQEGELFARYGGEEFVLALKGYTALEGEAFANKLRSYIETQPLATAQGNISVTLSCGVAEAAKETEETLYQLLNKADKALYEAKQAGRNRVHVYTGMKEVYK